MSGEVDFITAAENEILEALRADNFFQNITVLRTADGDIAAKIEEAVARLGLFIVLRISGGAVPWNGDAEDWNVLFVVSENPTINRAPGGTGKTARWAVQNLMRVLRSSHVCDAVECNEILGDDDVVWQLKARRAVSLPDEEET